LSFGGDKSASLFLVRVCALCKSGLALQYTQDSSLSFPLGSDGKLGKNVGTFRNNSDSRATRKIGAYGRYGFDWAFKNRSP
jgi:hypothetical protein